MRIKQAIPNLLTLGNLFCGILAIVVLLSHEYNPAAQPFIILILVCCSLVFDFLDGFVARLLKVSSPLGKELDSLADMVTFGVLPGLLVFEMIQSNTLSMGIRQDGLYTVFYPTYPVLRYVGIVIALFSALRLAKFNIDDRQSNSFIGLATPANTIFWLSVYLIFALDSEFCSRPFSTGTGTAISGGAFWINYNVPVPGFLAWENYLCHPWVLSILAVVFSLLLISPIRLMAFKFKGFSFSQNWNKYIFILVSVLLLIMFFYRAVPIIILLYFVFSILGNLFIRQNEIHSNG